MAGFGVMRLLGAATVLGAIVAQGSVAGAQERPQVVAQGIEAGARVEAVVAAARRDGDIVRASCASRSARQIADINRRLAEPGLSQMQIAGAASALGAAQAAVDTCVSDPVLASTTAQVPQRDDGLFNPVYVAPLAIVGIGAALIANQVNQSTSP